MRTATLYVSDLSAHGIYVCKDGTHIFMSQLIEELHGVVDALAAAGKIRENDSFGFAMTMPQANGSLMCTDDWDRPDKFVWFTGGWGPHKERYVANAVRKLRATLREGGDTLDLRQHSPESFIDVADSVDGDGNFAWGDFPWGGAVIVDVFGVVAAGAVSCLHEIEDDYVARLHLGDILKRIAISDGLVP
jgi:hypothetical protein